MSTIVDVKSLSAAGLLNTERFSRMDVYAVISLGGAQHRTAIHEDCGPNPRFMERIQLPLAPGVKELSVQFFNRRRMKADELLGTTKVNIQKAEGTGNDTVIAQVFRPDGVPQGQATVNVAVGMPPPRPPPVMHAPPPQAHGPPPVVYAPPQHAQSYHAPPPPPMQHAPSYGAPPPGHYPPPPQHAYSYGAPPPAPYYGAPPPQQQYYQQPPPQGRQSSGMNPMTAGLMGLAGGMLLGEMLDGE